MAGKKQRDPQDLENLRLVQKAEDEHEIEFKWEMDVDAHNDAIADAKSDYRRGEISQEEYEAVYETEYYYCVASAPDGRNSVLGGIGDPTPDYKTQVEADLARELGVEPDFLPPPEEEMHTMTGWNESANRLSLKIPDEAVESAVETWNGFGGTYYANFYAPERAGNTQARFFYEWAAKNEETWSINLYLYRVSKKGPAQIEIIISTHTRIVFKTRFDNFFPDPLLPFLASTSFRKRVEAEKEAIERVYQTFLGLFRGPPPEEEMHTMTGWNEDLVRLEARLLEGLVIPTPRFIEPLKKLEAEYPDYVSFENWEVGTAPRRGTAVFKASSRDAGSHFQLDTYTNPEENPGNWIVYRIAFHRSSENVLQRAYKYAFSQILGPNDNLPPSLEELIKISTDSVRQTGKRDSKVVALKDLKRTPELAEIYAKTARILNYVAPEEEMHTMTGWNEALNLEERREFFWNLEFGDHFIYAYENKPPEEYMMVKRSSSISIEAISLETGKRAIFWNGDPKVGPVEITPEEEMHTMTGWNEARIVETDETLVRRVTRALVDDNPLNY